MKKSELKRIIKEVLSEGFPTGRIMFTPANLEKTQKAADLVVQALGILEPEASFTVNPRIEEGSFDIDKDGEAYDGGSYSVTGAGIIFIDSIGDQKRIGMVGNSPEAVAQKLQKAEGEAPKEYSGGRYSDMNEVKYRVEYTNKEGEKFKSKIYNNKKEADDKHWKLAKSNKVKNIDVVKITEMRHEDSIKSVDGQFLSIGDVVKVEGLDGEYQIVVSGSGKAPFLLPHKGNKTDLKAEPISLKPGMKFNKTKRFSDTDGGFMAEDEIPGGKGDKAKASDFDHKEVKMGVKVEMEHTNSQRKAMEIALDHLTENPKYYSELAASGIDEH